MTSSPDTSRRLVILADGALLSERNARLKETGEWALDFNQIPSLVAKAVDAALVPTKETSYFFAVGAKAAESFITSISAAWTVHPFPLRAFSNACACGKPTVRFSPAIAWALGNASGEASRDVIVCLSNDPGLVMPIRFARDRNVDARLAWPDAAGEEVRYFANRNDVPLVHLEAGEGHLPKPPQSFGQTFLRPPTSPPTRAPAKIRPRRD